MLHLYGWPGFLPPCHFEVLIWGVPKHFEILQVKNMEVARLELLIYLPALHRGTFRRIAPGLFAEFAQRRPARCAPPVSS